MILRDNLRTLSTRRLLAAFGAVAILLAARAVAFAAATLPGAPDGRLAGYVAGVTMILLVGYAIYLCLKPVLGMADSGLFQAVLILVAIWLVKQSLLPLFPGFGIDVNSYQAWAMHIAEVGPAGTYRAGYFLDYPPGYLYALWVVGAIGHFVGVSGEAFRQLTETPALFADVLLALMMYAWLRRSKSQALAIAGMLLVALNPALLFDTEVWGQSDSVPALLMLLSVTSAIDGEFELSWALSAIGVLVKPQVLLFLPVLGFWTLLKADFDEWWRCALAGVATAVIAAMPFQIAHPWSWLPALYQSTAAYYHETSVNAFNLMALLAGLRQPDTTTILGVSCFTFGMTLLALVYAFVAWQLWRARSARIFFYCTFLTVFGSFVLAPRMHERYLYPALVFAVPLALEQPLILGVLVAISSTFLFNLAYVKHVLESKVIFLDPRDGWAMLVAAINVVALGAAMSYGFAAAPEEQAHPEESALEALIARIRAPAAFTAAPPPAAALERSGPLTWIRTDTVILVVLLVGAVATRFWRLGLPAEIVFDEVHFVGQARHYLHGEWFLDPHPPLAKLMIAAGVWLFGDHPASWRLGNALTGTALVAITYLLGRRMFHSRLAATLAAAFVLGDGMFLIDSRIAVLDIVYITYAAWAYLLLFRFYETADPLGRRRVLPWMGLALGLCLGSKLYIPAVTWLLVVGFLCYILWEPAAPPGATVVADPQRMYRVGGAVLLTGAISGAVYIAIFLPHFILGWWGGIADLFHYYRDVIWYENSVASATHPYSAPWWSWPLMLRPIAYWQNFPRVGKVATIWGGGNPASWWGALTAIVIIAAQALERPSLWRSFLVIGYLGYLVIWIPIGRTLFLYHYMGSVYLGYLALGVVLAQCWHDEAQPWEHLALLLTLGPVFILGLPRGWGIAALVATLAAYFGMLSRRPPYAGKFTCVLFVAVVLILFVYYLPIWIGLPMERAGYYARMWLQGPGLRNWI